MARARAEIIACETCGGAPLDPGDRSRGTQLIEHLRREASSRRVTPVDVAHADIAHADVAHADVAHADVASTDLTGPEPSTIDVGSTRCLWACKKSCAVMLRSPGRVGYVIVELEPTATSARALFDYADLYLRSEDGAVPYRSWPPELKGHFLCRTPRLTVSDTPDQSTCSPIIARGDEDLTP